MEDKKKRGSFAKGAKAEFKKIIWPTKSETINYTIVVVVITVILAVAIWAVDSILKGLLSLIIK